MSYPINYPTPQGANIQIFNAGETKGTQTWVKPQGASFVWFTLIGAGGGGGGSDGSTADGCGGGSGAVTNCMVPAFLIPDELQIQVGLGGKGNANNSGTSGQSTSIQYQGLYTLLSASGGTGGQANGGGGGAGGTASTSNFFSCMGFFQSVTGQGGVISGSENPSATTFLSGGSSGSNASGLANYGYQLTGTAGYFQMQPIIFGIGGSADNLSSQGYSGGIGCGGGGAGAAGGVTITTGGAGGNGLVVIITW